MGKPLKELVLATLREFGAGAGPATPAASSRLVGADDTPPSKVVGHT